ncbi:CinA family protein [Clostridium botulinum]|uniref:CinA family protein n=1 Tax=Clostridium botulinum TaxID=1491 RepID=UPI00217D1C8A|nr:nicotinamide-nucleotide amidohydrolase family protein [Clostridium botulinum]MCS6105732.1 CinA family protein [Clostridium botulinum]
MTDKVADFFKTIEQADYEQGIPNNWQEFPKQVVEKLKQKHLKITAAESLTAGMFQAKVASIPGASNVFDGGFVTYADEVKIQLLGMDPNLIEKYTVVSSSVAFAMAKLSAEKLTADIGVGFTGVAGPDPLEGNSVGTVFISAYNATNNEKIVKEFHFSGSRQAIREKSVLCGFVLVQEII